MNRVTRGSVLLAAALVALSCEGDPTGDLRNGADHLVATPSALIIVPGEPHTVLVTVVDDQGNTLESKFSLDLPVPAGLTVVEDSLYNLVYDNNGNQIKPSKWTRSQYIVTATANSGDLSFTVSAGGKSLAVPVRIAAAAPTVLLSKLTTAAVTDTITATVAAPFRFTSTTKVTVGTATAHVVSISGPGTPSDSTVISFVPPAAQTKKVASFSDVRLSYIGGSTGLYALTSGTDSVSTPALPALPFTTAAVLAGDSITLTAPAGWRFTPGTTGQSLPSVDTAGVGGTLPGAGLIRVSADSSTLKFAVGPSRNGRVVVTNVQIRGASRAGRYTMRSATTEKVTSGAAPLVTISTAAAAAGDTITVTAPAGWRFKSGSSAPSVDTAGVGGPLPGVFNLGPAADSLTLKFIVGPGRNGQVRVTNLTLPGSPTGPAFTLNSGAVKLVSTSPALAVSNAAPAIGDTVTVTVPAGWRFTPGATVTSTTGSLPSVPGTSVQNLGVSTDSLRVRFIIGPAANGQVAVTNVKMPGAISASAPSFTLKSAAVTSPAAPALTVLPSGAANIGDTITVTAPAGWHFRPAGTNSSVPTVTGVAGVQNLGPAADSLTLKFVIGPNANGAVSVTNMTMPGAPVGPRFTLLSTATLTTPVVTNFPATLSKTSPARNDTITLTAGAGFKLLPSATVRVGTTLSGGLPGSLVSVAADSSSMKFLVYPNDTTATVVVTGVVLATNPKVSLTLPSTATITTAAAGISPPDSVGVSGTDLPSTAPIITIPATGVTRTEMDAGPFASSGECDNLGNDCRFYKFVLTGWRTFTVTLRWSNTADLGGYFTDIDGNDLFGDFACDAGGSGASGQPESCSQTILPAGEYWLALANFSAVAPVGVRIDITGE